MSNGWEDEYLVVNELMKLCIVSDVNASNGGQETYSGKITYYMSGYSNSKNRM